MDTNETAVTICAHAQEPAKAGIVERLIERAKSYRQHLRAKRQAEDAQQLTDSFQVKEYNGKLWITCRGVAIYEINPGTNANSVVALIAEARRSALAFNS